MHPKQQTRAVPPGFSRPLSVGEVPLMACADHNRHPDAPASKTYKMTLPASEKQARGYHALRFMRLRRVYLKQRWQKLALILVTASVGLSLIFWEQFTFPLLVNLQNSRILHMYTPTSVDIQRCNSVGLPSLYVGEDLTNWAGTERSELIQQAWQTSLPGFPRRMDYRGYEIQMAILEILTRALTASKIEHALVGGSLVGSYLFHDVLPWDKFLDIGLRRADAGTVQSVISKLDLVEAFDRNLAYTPSRLRKWLNDSHSSLQLEENAAGSRTGRIYLKSSSGGSAPELSSIRLNVQWWQPRARGPEDRDPSFEGVSEVVEIDVPTTDGTADSVPLPASEWYPLTGRPLGMLVVPAPVNPLFYVNAYYKSPQPFCSTRSARNSGFLGLNELTKGTCSMLWSIYPHVERDEVTEDCMRELLVARGKTKLTAYVAGRSRPAKQSSWFSLWD
ncbi:transmembrane protein [Cystoisospora suis]|uniref:Transmembrane protein n=1 Tax=Cystoisospora suis TaxID=483139 RepID=A0A2C6KQG2_9APIC|nr:transmembrane protein [Cystoisospora suis]